MARENEKGEPRIELKKHGSLTLLDPRLWIPNFDMIPKYVCQSDCF
jgi:hypothetical protein